MTHERHARRRRSRQRRRGHELDLPQGDLAYRDGARRRPSLLPGEVRPHPDPFQYVIIAVILVVITAVEIAVSYLEGDIPDGLIVVLLLAMAVVKFFLVASWYMHLRTDQPIFRASSSSGRSPPRSCST